LALARQTSDAKVRAATLVMAQRWIDFAGLAEHNAYSQSLLRRRIQVAIGEELKAIYRLSRFLPPHFLALLAQLNAANAPHEDNGPEKPS
jgi:hypothetical protein